MIQTIRFDLTPRGDGPDEHRQQGWPRGRRRLDVGHLFHRRPRGTPDLSGLRRRRSRGAVRVRRGRLPALVRRAADEEGVRRLYKTLSSTATRRLPPKLVTLLRGLPKKTTPMEVLRTGVSALSAFDPEDPDNSREAEIRKAMRLTAQMPTLVAAWERIRRGKAPIAPNPKLNLAANFLYMMSGKKPTELAVKTFDVALILHADHEFNASTFAARVT